MPTNFNKQKHQSQNTQLVTKTLVMLNDSMTLFYNKLYTFSFTELFF